MGANGQAQFNGALDRALVHHRQGAGQGQVHRAGLGVGLGAEGRGGAAENFALGGELGMRLEADHDFVALDKFGAHAVAPGWRVCQSVAVWYWWATFSKRASFK